EVGGDEQNTIRVRVIRVGTVHPHPEGVAGAGARRADVRVAVVAVDAPGGEHALGVAVFPRAADVVHDLVRRAALDRGANAPGEIVECHVPAHALPLPLAARTGAAQRIENALGIVDLVERGRTFG